MQQSKTLVSLLLLLFSSALLFLLASSSAAASPAPSYGSEDIFDPYLNWTKVQYLRDTGAGQDWYNFSDAVDISFPFVAVGSTSANNGKGLVRMYHNDRSGFHLVATIKDPAGTYGDGFGSRVYFFIRVGFYHVAVTSINKNSDGSVLVFRLRSITTPGDWFLSDEILPPETEHVTKFGRSLRFDGDVLIIGSEERYAYGVRFVISSINVVGTRDFIQTSGIDEMPSDPVFLFRSINGRDNTTAFNLVQTLRDGPYTYNYGESLDQHGDNLVVGASFRTETLFGFGTDGDLVVDGVHLLDGSAEYNFNSITILPGGTLTTDGYDPLRGAGGIMKLNVFQTLTIHPGGAINMSARGYKGAATRFSYSRFEHGDGPGRGYSSTSPFIGDFSCQYDGTDVLTASLAVDFQSLTIRNNSLNTTFAEACGGGASYSTKGTDGTAVQCGTSGVAGDLYGQPELLTEIYRGSGGGAGQPWKVGSGGKGGDGGGQIIINARILVNDGTIESNGSPGGDGSFFSGAGGGGSGGAILLRGSTFTNNGVIEARGGAGGYRSVDSGSGRGIPPFTRGGDGGDGRIRVDFLTKVAVGTIQPEAYNTTLWDGAVYWYKKRTTTDGLYELVTKLPRVDTMQFIGHSVAIHNETVAIANDERTLQNPHQSVYLVDLQGVINDTSPYARWREILPPLSGNADMGFGYEQMYFDHNETSLLISANGANLTRGVSYLLVGTDLFTATDRLDVFEALPIANFTSNEYGVGASYKYPYIVTRVPTSQDTRLGQLSRESAGTVAIIRHFSNISALHSSVDCQYASATQNTTVICYIRTRDVLGRATGDLHNLADFDYPANLSYVQDGVYTWVHTAKTMPLEVIAASYLGQPINGTFNLAVTSYIDPYHSNFTCTPKQVVPGQVFTCVIITQGSDGEVSAAKDFDVVVYNTEDVELQVQADDVSTPLGVFRPPRSKYISVDPLQFDFPTISPTVTWIRRGVYQFQFTPWRPGAYAAFAKYQNVPLRFPNPVILDAWTPPVDPKDSLVSCPTVWAPNRTIACTFQMSGAGGDGGDAALVANYSRRVYATAFMNGKPQSVNAVWAGEGRISLLTFPAETGILTMQVKYKDATIGFFPPAGVTISPSFATNCQRVSLLLQSFTLHNQVAKGYADEAVWKEFVQKASYTAGIGMCDTPLL